MGTIRMTVAVMVAGLLLGSFMWATDASAKFRRRGQLGNFDVVSPSLGDQNEDRLEFKDMNRHFGNHGTAKINPAVVQASSPNTAPTPSALVRPAGTPDIAQRSSNAIQSTTGIQKIEAPSVGSVSTSGLNSRKTTVGIKTSFKKPGLKFGKMGIERAQRFKAPNLPSFD